MEIEEVSAKEYKNHFQQVYHVFASTSFNELNADKCNEVFYLLFRDKKVRLGIIGGIRDYIFYSPFSAPFGGFITIKDDIKIQIIDQAIDLLRNWADSKGLKSIQITLPPNVYQESFISKLINSFYRNNFLTKTTDLNYSFDLTNFDKNYTNLIWRNARKNLNKALANDFVFKLCENEKNKELAYQIININREARGFPLRMSWKQIKETIQIIKADFFLLFNNSDRAIASAMIFYVSPKIVQVVYWGDLPQFSHLKTMNFLSYKIFEYYKETDIKIIDIGPSTENSIPNYGLCEFKESIGCNISTKFTFTKEL